jgi:MoaA/NifB/PqqE/SkfB family radical SAM enzyme
MFEFANLLFSGPCNARCPLCIGRLIDPARNRNNLDEYPPQGLERFLELLEQHGIRQLALTGTNTDPQLYRHEARILEHLRQRLPPGTQLSLHTNGRLALRKMEVFNQYDRVCLSLPSFEAHTYQRLMGVSGVPDMEAILQRTNIPVKLSCLVMDENTGEIPAYLKRAASLGIRRVVLRQPYQRQRPWSQILNLERLGLELHGHFSGNPIYRLEGLEVTLWDFTRSECRVLNLFASGEISPVYLLASSPGQDSRGSHRDA